MTWGRAQPAASPATMDLASPARASRRAGGPAQSMSPASSPAGNGGSLTGALIDARSLTGTTKGMRGLYRRQHQILAKGV